MQRNKTNCIVIQQTLASTRHLLSVLSSFEDLDAHRWKLPWSPADQNNVNIDEEKNLLSNINEEK